MPIGINDFLVEIIEYDAIDRCLIDLMETFALEFPPLHSFNSRFPAMSLLPICVEKQSLHRTMREIAHCDL